MRCYFRPQKLVKHDSKNYQGRALCYLLKAEVLDK